MTNRTISGLTYWMAYSVVALLLLLLIPVLVLPAEPPWERTAGPPGGLMESIAMHPLDPDVMYASGQGGGVYKTVDGGRNWQLMPIDNCNPEEILHTILIDPQKPDTVYVASCTGIRRTTDGGMNWSRCSSGIEGCHLNIRVLTIDPTTSGTLYQTQC